MKNTLCSALYFSVLLAFGFSNGVAQKAPEPEKLALIREFLAVTEATKGANETSDLMLGLQATEAAKMVNTLIDDDETLSPETKEELKRTATASSERSMNRIREFFATRLKFEEIILEVAIPIYDKHFTAADLRDIIAFYKTPTGKRMIEVTPKLTMELMTGMMEKMMPKLQEFIKEAAESELKILRETKRPARFRGACCSSHERPGPDLFFSPSNYQEHKNITAVCRDFC